MEALRERLDHGFDYDPESPNDKLLIDACRIILTTQAKVDETRLRKKQTDMMPKLLEIIAQERKKLPILDLVPN